MKRDLIQPAVALLAYLLTGTVSATACLHYENHIHGVSTIEIVGLCHDIESDGSNVFLATGNRGFQVVDVSDPLNGFVRATLPTLYALSIHCESNFAYVAGGFEGIKIVDVTDPDHPIQVGALDTIDFAHDVAVRGDVAYVADHTAGLILFDVGDRGAPRRIRDPLPPVECRGVHLHEDLLVAIGQEPNLALYELGRPEQPILLGTLDLPAVPRGAVIREDKILVADYDEGLVVVDISDPTECYISQTYDTPGLAHDVLAHGDRVFVADLDNGVVVYDVLTPFQLVQAGRLITFQGRSLTTCSEIPILADGTHGLVTILQPDAPFAQHCDWWPDVQSEGLAVRDGLVASMSYGGVTLFELHEDGSLQVVSELDLNGDPRNALFHDDYLLVEDNDLGLQVVDISDPTTPLFVTYLQFFVDHSDMAIRTPYLYVPAYLWGLQIFDISDPTSPIHVNLGMGVYDSRHTSIEIVGDLAYITSGTGHLIVYDLGSDPVHPVEIGRMGTLSYPLDVAISGDTGYLATREDGLVVFDCSSPEDPWIVSTYPTPDWATNIRVARNVAYLAVKNMGIRILDVTDRSRPHHLGFVLDGVSAQDLELDETKLIAALNYDGLAVLPRQCGDETTQNSAPPIFDPLHLTLSPNPCNPATEVSLALDTAQHVVLAIYDARGQRVSILHSGWLDSGRHAIRWSGQSDTGRPQPTGVYFVRAEGIRGVSVRKLMLMK